MNEKNTESENRIRVGILHENHGASAAQKEQLVTDILSQFQEPRKWPMTDVERVAVLRNFYSAALLIRETEAAERNAK